MTLSTVRQLREQRGAVVRRAQLLIPADGKAMSAEDRRRFDSMMAEADALKNQIDAAERQAEVDSLDTRRTHRPPEAQIGSGFDGANAEREQRHARAFTSYLRRGLDRVSEEDRAVLSQPQYRDMGVGAGDLGGYFVPQGFVYEIEQAMKFYGQMLQTSRILDTATGNPLPYPTVDDVSVSGEIVGEGSPVTTADVSVGHIIFGAYKFSTKMVKVSLELLQDSAFDVENFLSEQFGLRLGRIINSKTTSGAGTTEPLGIITAVVAANGTPQAASAGVVVGTPLVAAGSAGNTGGSETGATTIGTSDIINLEHTVDPLYRRGAKYMCHDQTVRQIKTLLDKYGRPLWQPGIAASEPDRINGYEYAVNNDMDTVATGKVTMVFGALDRYLIRRVRALAVLRLVERFADYGQVAFLGFARYDGNLLDAGTHPVNYLKQA